MIADLGISKLSEDRVVQGRVRRSLCRPTIRLLDGNRNDLVRVRTYGVSDKAAELVPARHSTVRRMHETCNPLFSQSPNHWHKVTDECRARPAIGWKG